MKYRITARAWSSDMQAQFGAVESVVELSDSDLISALLKYGRADLYQESEELRVLDIQNDYDIGIANVRLVR